MSEKSWHLSRREMLHGGGIALALPLLNSMSWARVAAAKDQPKRMVVSYLGYGVYDPRTKDGSVHPGSWYPRHDSGPITFNQASKPFESLEKYVSYLRGLDHAGGYGLGGHSSGDVFGSGADMSGPEKTNNISVDQLAAKVHGHKTRYASLVLGTEGGTGSYGMAKTLSHRGPGRPVPALHRPQEIFNGLFRPYASKTVNDVRAELKREASVLDLMMENYRSLHGKLGAEDRQKMDEYLESIRALEERVERTSRWTHEPLPKVDTKGLSLEASYQDPTEYVRCLYDLLYLALQTDATRFASFMTESEHSTGNPVGNFANQIFGYTGATHDIAHKRPEEASLKWEQWRAEQHAYFLKRLRDTPEGEGNMLDHTVVLWGSAHPHASHSTKNYPVQVAGGNKLGFQHGRLHAFEEQSKVPLANLFVSMLNAVDTPAKKFADSTGELTEVLA